MIEEENVRAGVTTKTQYSQTLPYSGMIEKRLTYVSTEANPDTNYSHIWDGVDLNNQDSLWIKNAKTYHLTLVDKNTTCKSLDSVIIMHDTLPIINLGVDSGFCEGDTISLFAGSGYYSYNWSTTPLRAADTSHTIKVSGSLAYTLSGSIFEVTSETDIFRRIASTTITFLK